MTDLYLDYNASTPVRPEVAAACLAHMTADWGNAGAAHPAGREARRSIERARAQVAAALGASPPEVYFTSGGTESNNWALFGTLRALGPGHIVVSAIEHPSVLRTAEALEREGSRVTQVLPGPDGALRAEDVEAALRPDTRLVSLMVANNETGILQPVAEVGELCRARGVRLHTDAVCSAGKLPHDVRALGCDLLSLSSHKLYAPKGAGVLVVREGTRLAPLIHGCGQQGGLRSGTENTSGCVGLGLALELSTRELAEVAALAELREALWEGLVERFDVRRNGRGPGLANTLNVAFPGQDALALQTALGQRGISVSAASSSVAGQPSHVLLAMGLPLELARASLRFSLGAGSTPATLESLFQALESILPRAPSTRANVPRRPSHSPAHPVPHAPIDELCQALVAELTRDSRPTQIAPLLRRYAERCQDWREFARFGSRQYTRNLVHRCGAYELLLLCWDEGQVSPIHNHAGQSCWMAVLEGELEEVHFRQESAGAPLIEGRTSRFAQGSVAFIEDDIALHLIRPARGRGVSLHLYARPIDTCHVYDPTTGRASEIELGYHSVRGEPCTRSVEAIRAEFA